MRKLLQRLFIISLLIWSTTILSCSKVYNAASIAPQRYEIDSIQTADQSYEAIIAPYTMELKAEMDKAIGENKNELIKEQPESTLGNFAADALLIEGKKYYPTKTIDFAIVNYGGLRIPSLASGAITKGDIFELMPFDNMVVLLEAKGTIVQQLFKRMAEGEGWPVSDGISYQIKNLAAQEILINGSAIDPNKTYGFLVSDYLANGGDQLSFLKDIPQQDCGVLLRDAFMNYVEALTAKGEIINVKKEGRVIDVQ